MRIALLLSSLAFAACTVGEVGTANNNNNPDGGGSGSDSGSNMGTDPNACVDRLAQPDPETDHTNPVVATNKTNAGQNCIVAGCHLNNSLGLNAPGFQFAGTVYKQGTTQPQAGAAIRIIDSNGKLVASTYTDQAGNFHFPAGTLSGTFTATTNVSACPTVTPMVTKLVGGNGGGAGANSCNLCHTTGAGAQAVPIYLQ